MRSVLARLVLAGLVGAVAAGCGTSGSSQQIGALPNGNGGGSAPYTNVPASSTTAAPFSVKPVLIDSGYEFAATPAPSASPAPTPAYVYKGVLGTTVVDAVSSAQPAPDVLPSSAPSGSPALPAGIGSHQLTFAAGGLPQVFLQYQKTVPDLIYNKNSSAPAGAAPAYFDYSTIVLHLAYAPSTATPPGTLASVAVEVSGSDTAGSFDVRVACTGTPGVAPAFGVLTCPKFPALGAIANTTGPNPVLPGATLGFDPAAAFAPKLTIVLNYTAPVPTTSTGNVMFVSDVYATQ
jgi:hypothetical protein